MQSITITPPRRLRGTIEVPGDKSISHRALMLGALAVGRTEISGLLEGEDVLATAAALNALGAHVTRADGGRWTVDGVGIGALAEPDDLLDLGNAGTAARLLLGILATHSITAFVTGDASLRRRPMGRVVEPLSRFGARFVTREGARLPLVVSGAADPVPISYRLPVPSAQVKSSVLLAGLNSPGATTVLEPQATRDHTERMLRHFGAMVDSEPAEGGGKRITVGGHPELAAAPIAVPGDPSSAAFPLIAALIVPGSEVTIEGVGDHRAPSWPALAYLAQRFALLTELSVAENVALPLRLSRERDDARVGALLDQLALGDLADRKPAEISIGQQQRAALARALAPRPVVLVADEPTSHQDRASAALVWGALSAAADDGTACLVATHEEAAAGHAGRVWRIVDGRVTPDS